ncbi:hypothetical protein Tco_1578454 [Tanacetum coccineum]
MVLKWGMERVCLVAEIGVEMGVFGHFIWKWSVYIALYGSGQCLFSCCVAKLLELKFEWILPGLRRRVAFNDVEEKNATIKAFLTATQHTHA